MTDDASVQLHAADGLYVWAELNPEGVLIISGQDLRPGFGLEEYEYAFTVLPQSVPLVRSALDGANDDSILALLAAAGKAIVGVGVQHWLDQIGARYEFWSRSE